MRKEDIYFFNGKWNFPDKKVNNEKPEPQKEEGPMMCVVFPLGQVKEICVASILYTFSILLGISLAFNLFWYLEMRRLEQKNLKMLDVIKKENLQIKYPDLKR